MMQQQQQQQQKPPPLLPQHQKQEDQEASTRQHDGVQLQKSSSAPVTAADPTDREGPIHQRQHHSRIDTVTTRVDPDNVFLDTPPLSRPVPHLQSDQANAAKSSAPKTTSHMTNTIADKPGPVAEHHQHHHHQIEWIQHRQHLCQVTPHRLPRSLAKIKMIRSSGAASRSHAGSRLAVAVTTTPTNTAGAAVAFQRHAIRRCKSSTLHIGTGGSPSFQRQRETLRKSMIPYKGPIAIDDADAEANIDSDWIDSGDERDYDNEQDEKDDAKCIERTPLRSRLILAAKASRAHAPLPPQRSSSPCPCRTHPLLGTAVHQKHHHTLRQEQLESICRHEACSVTRTAASITRSRYR